MQTVPPSSYRRQQLLLEYAAIKSKCPDGIYLTPSSSNPAAWSGVLFVRKGPYQSAVLRFEIAFPAEYPQYGPAITFATEIFHPLLVPLTTYTFAAGAVDPNATLGSTETERLAPGSFNVRHEFADWYSHKAAKGVQIMANAEAQGEVDPELARRGDVAGLPGDHQAAPKDGEAMLLELLSYLKRAFEDNSFLDDLPVSAAVNTNAWHAWRAHRCLPKLASRSISPASADSGRTPLSPGRSPGDWNWDGVWDSRVRSGIEESLSDVALYGAKNARPAMQTSGPIRFAKNDDTRSEEIQGAMLRAMGLNAV